MERHVEKAHRALRKWERECREHGVESGAEFEIVWTVDGVPAGSALFRWDREADYARVAFEHEEATT